MSDDILKEAKEAFAQAQDAEAKNRTAGLDDLRFARLSEQWPEDAIKLRGADRPRLTINKMPAFIRQVVNDARQNKPQIKVHPVDSGADKEVAEIYNGLIRNIEYTSNADVAYDTATECAVGIGFGYFRVDLHYAHEDTFDLDICIDRISNPFSVYGDPRSTAADSSDWNTSFVTEMVPKSEFAKRYKGAASVDWGAEEFKRLGEAWVSDDSVMVAEWWRREEYEKPIYQLSDGTVQSKEALEQNKDLWAIQGLRVVNERMAKCHRVKQYLLTGADMLEKNDWVGKYIPIIPVYGDEVDVEGKRYFKSLIRDAKDAQRMFNYWRTTATELVALAPRVPFIGKKGAFKTDAAKWQTANTQNHPYLEYDGDTPPQRQPLDGRAAGALQEALNASDDMKAIIGLYDASLGARSNETSGRAINARKLEGDVSTFHFQDNMARALRHCGRVQIDIIPKVYNKARILRTIGQDGTPSSVAVNQPTEVKDKDGNPVIDEKTGLALTRIYDLGAGKYDLTVSTGPSFTTRREEAAVQMTEMLRSFPDAAPVIGDLIAKNLDWPGADEIAERLKAINPALNKQGGGVPPEVQQQIQEGMQRLQQLEQENQQLGQENQQIKAANELKALEIQVKREEASIKGMEADIKRLEAETDQFRAWTERLGPPEEPEEQKLAAKEKEEMDAKFAAQIAEAMAQVADTVSRNSDVITNIAQSVAQGNQAVVAALTAKKAVSVKRLPDGSLHGESQVVN